MLISGGGFNLESRPWHHHNRLIILTISLKLQSQRQGDAEGCRGRAIAVPRCRSMCTQANLVDLVRTQSISGHRPCDVLSDQLHAEKVLTRPSADQLVQSVLLQSETLQFQVQTFADCCQTPGNEYMSGFKSSMMTSYSCRQKSAYSNDTASAET